MKLCMNVCYGSSMADKKFGFNWLLIVAAPCFFLVEKLYVNMVKAC